MKQVEFIKLEDIIKQILIDNEKARNDDSYLYYVYCRDCVKDLLTEADFDFVRVFYDTEYRKKLNIRSCKAVFRCRRKIQAENPELASERTKKKRAKEEESYKEYSRI